MRLSTTLASLLLPASVAGHARIMNPKARTVDSGLKSYPCGGKAAGMNGYTRMAPGVFEVEFEEEIFHTGAPFRFALGIGVQDDNFDLFVLADHIPHNDDQAARNGGLTKYKYKLDIPNIDCPKCTLQLVNPMTDKLSSASPDCIYPASARTDPSQPAVCFSVYHSCSDIEITGSQDPVAFRASYSNIPNTQYSKGEAEPYTPLGANNEAWVLPSNWDASTKSPTAPTASAPPTVAPSSSPTSPTSVSNTPAPTIDPEIGIGARAELSLVTAGLLLIGAIA